MKMIRLIALKEFREIIRDGRFKISVIILFALLLLSLVTGWKYYVSVSLLHAEAQEHSREQWVNQGEKNPHSAAHFGSFAFKPKRLLSLIDNGLEKYLGTSIWVEAHKQNEAKSRFADDATALLRFGELTGSFILQYLITLLIIILGYSTISGEKEKGTLRLLYSQGVSTMQLFVGKSAGIVLVILVIYLPAVLISILFLSFSAGYESLGDAWVYILLFFGSYFVYYLVFVFLSIGISSVSPSSSLSMAGLIMLWILFCVLIPRVSVLIAEKAHPTPSAFDFITQVEFDLLNGPDGHNPADKQFQQIEQDLMKKYKLSNAEDLPINMMGISLQVSEEHGYKVFDHHYSTLDSLYKKQNSVHRTSALLSPFVGIKSLSMGLAGTDIEEHKHFADEVEQYRRKEIKMINDNIAYNSNNKSGRNYIQGKNLWEKIPAFQYASLSLSQTLDNHKQDLISLVIWLVISAGLALLFIHRIHI